MNIVRRGLIQECTSGMHLRVCAVPLDCIRSKPCRTSSGQRVHVDFAKPFQGTVFLLAVDAHSKWPEVFIMQSTTADKTIEVLRHLFSAHGLPEQVVTDNSPQFISDEFASFLKGNGVKHIRIPYHPASNGLVERFVQSFKQALRASQNDGRSLNNRLSTFLLTYRSTSHATTGVPPCNLFLRRKLRTRFDLLKPNGEDRVFEKQAKQKLKELGDGVAMDNSTDDSELTYPQPTSAVNDEVTEAPGSADPVEPPQVEPVPPEVEPPDTQRLPVVEPVVPMSRYPTRVRKPPDRLQ